MTSIKPGLFVVPALDVMEGGGQSLVSVKGGGAFCLANIFGCQIPGYPIRFAPLIVVILGQDTALNEVVLVVAGIGLGIAWIAQFHLVFNADMGSGNQRNEQEEGCKKPFALM